MSQTEYDWHFEMAQAMSNRGDWFTSHLLRLISKADLTNREKLREGFPDHVAAYERWLKGSGEFDPNQPNYPREVIVHGRRWRDQFNTYHSVMVEADGEVIGVEPFAYGYGDQYIETGLEILIDKGVLPKLVYENGVPYGLRRTCEELGVDLVAEAYDVKRKRELHEPLEGSNV